MNGRQDKHQEFNRKPRGRMVLIGIGLAVLVLIAGAVWILRPGTGQTFQTVQASGDILSLPAAPLADGRARFYRYHFGDQAVDFFLVQSHDGVIRAALDTCDVCYKARKGYRQEGGFMVCNNCDQQFRTDLVNEVKGGCNPAPLERNIEGGQILIRVAELEAGRRYFVSTLN